MLNPKDIWLVWATHWCAERKAGVGTVRVETTFLWMSDHVSEWVDESIPFKCWLLTWRLSRVYNEWIKLYHIAPLLSWVEKNQCPEFNPVWSARVLVALLTFRLTEQGTFISAHEKKQGFLHRHIPVPAISLLLCSLDGVVKPWREQL